MVDPETNGPKSVKRGLTLTFASALLWAVINAIIGNLAAAPTERFLHWARQVLEAFLGGAS